MSLMRPFLPDEVSLDTWGFLLDPSGPVGCDRRRNPSPVSVHTETPFRVYVHYVEQEGILTATHVEDKHKLASVVTVSHAQQ